MLGHLLAATLATTPGLMVMDFASQGGADADLAAAASTAVSQELERLGVFRVMSSETTRVMLGLERQKALMGCETCGGGELNDLALSAEFLVTGKVVRAGGQLSLLLTLLKAGDNSPVSTQRAESTTPAGLLAEARPAALKLVGRTLEGRRGTLLVTASELGAAVKVDDTQVGTTPLDGPVPLAPGPHLVSVEKDGFTQSRREVRINPDETSEADFRLVPSPDTIAAYEAKAGRTRVLAFTAVGLAVAGGVLFGLGQAEADGYYGSPATPGTFLYHQAKLLQGLEVEGDVDHRALATELKNTVQTWQIVSLSALAVAGVATIAGVVLFIVGDPPDKYEGLRKSADVVQVTLAPTLGGAVLSGSF